MSHVKPGKWRKNNLISAKGTSPVVRETGNGQAASSPHIKYTENKLSVGSWRKLSELFYSLNRVSLTKGVQFSPGREVCKNA